MLDQYIPVLMQVIVAIGFAASCLIASVVVGRSGTRNAMKDSAYECGMLPVGDSQPRFSVKFYLVAMLFVIFDIEVVFMYPWAVTFKDFLAAGNVATMAWSMLGFVGILLVAYVYALKKGALSWKD
ncbi:MAG: NADH-quinone oxidoreductase subunit A [Verrucomicrobiales bacterium]|jgi:NADH-quinone oxidoreductase subunit A